MLGGMMINVGDIVKVFHSPEYWDTDDNQEAFDNLDDDAYDPDEFPGFNSDMYDMVGHEFEIIEKHQYQPWYKLKDQYRNSWWFHWDWLKLATTVQLSDEDMKSKYKSVIIKIKRMEQRRKGAGYAF
jgi:hypothetical protein